MHTSCFGEHTVLSCQALEKHNMGSINSKLTLISFANYNLL